MARDLIAITIGVEPGADVPDSVRAHLSEAEQAREAELSVAVTSRHM